MCLCMHIRRSRWEPRQIHPQPPLPFSSTGCLLTTAPSMIALSRGRYNVLVCAISFAILFAAYNTLQNYATSLFPGNLGQVSLGVLYGVAGITVFTGPALTHVFGTKYVMFGGALCYVVYLVSLIWLSVPLVLTTSVIIGWGAAVLWIALGVFLTENSTKATYATNTGLFWSIFQFNNIVGNLTTYFVISNVTNSTAVLYLGFAVVAGVGTLGLLLLRPAKEEGEELEEASELLGAANSGGDSESSTLPSMSLLQHLGKAGRDALAALRLLPTPNMLLLLPVFFFSGGELAFWTGEFPLLLSNASMANIGLVLTWAGVGEVLGGFTMGRLSDLVGRSVSLVLSLGLYGGALALTCQLKLGTALATPTLWGSPVIAFIAAFLFGLADAGFNTNAYAMCSQLYSGESTPKEALLESAYSLQEEEEEEEEGGGGGSRAAPRDPRSSVGAFTIFQLIQNAGSALWYLVSLRMPVHDAPGTPGTFSQIYVQIAFLVLVGVTFVALDLRNPRSKA